MVTKWCFDNDLFWNLASRGGYQVAKFTLFRSNLNLLTSKIAFYFHSFLSLIFVPIPTLIFPSLFYTSLLKTHHLWGWSRSLSLFYFFYMFCRVLKVGPKLCYWEDFLVTCTCRQILCLASGFPKALLYILDRDRSPLACLAITRRGISNYISPSEGGYYSGSFLARMG